MRRMLVAMAAVGAVWVSGNVGWSQQVDVKGGELNGESQFQPFQAPDGMPFVVAETPWEVDQRGNHRAVVEVETSGKAVQVDLAWRRPDVRIDSKKIVVVDAKTNQEIANVKVLKQTADLGSVVFEPKSGKGTYYVYYLPYTYREQCDDARYGYPRKDYLPPKYQADTNWVAGLEAKLPVAKVARFESVSAFDFFTQMGVTATGAEKESLMAKHPGKEAILFPEDRAFPIRPYIVPARWVRTGALPSFSGVAAKNEYYTWQIGVWAARSELKHVKLAFSDLQGPAVRIPKGEMTCFNQEGVNWDGKPLAFTVNVPKGRVQALWCGVQIPKDAPAGIYRGVVTFRADNAAEQKIPVSIEVTEKMLADHGDGDLWRHARLRWLNSRIGEDNHPVAPFGPMKLAGRTITATEKTLKLAPNGFPASISVNGKETLARPFRFVITTEKGEVALDAKDLAITQEADGLVTWKFSQKSDGISISGTARMEFDGYVDYDLQVSAAKAMAVKDIRLEADYTPYASAYFMGVGHSGGACPASHTWDWQGPWDSYWMGNALAGVHMELRGDCYHGPLLRDYRPAPPRTWANEGKGTVTVSSVKGKGAKVVAHTGADTLSPEPRNYEFALLITPPQPLSTKKQFTERYTHLGNINETPQVDEAVKSGANVVIIHHGEAGNPVINYPFIIRKPLVDFIEHEHQLGAKVKLYYTIRELTNHAREIYALKSLGDEIYASGPGYFKPWTSEHLIDDYAGAWYQPLPGGGADASLKLTGQSRWINYYLEGLRWMFENYGMDGIYMDDVSFDRPVLKRMRKIMARYRPGALIDLHSNTSYSVGPANQYTGFFAYIDRLWFGEFFEYEKLRADEWFVTVSGIPFGLMSEMLMNGGNKYLGAVYGATNRLNWPKYSPLPIWKVWDEFGIAESKMMGYWDEACPVRSSDEEVKASAFVKADQVLISLGNFAEKDKTVRLDFDWKALGMSPDKATLSAPFMTNFQERASFTVKDEIPVKAKKGWMLILSEKK